MKVTVGTPYFFHSVKSEKSALILVKKPGCFTGTPVFVPIDFVKSLEPGDVDRFEYDYEITPWIIDGQAMTSKTTGAQLMCLA